MKRPWSHHQSRLATDSQPVATELLSTSVHKDHGTCSVCSSWNAFGIRENPTWASLKASASACGESGPLARTLRFYQDSSGMLWRCLDKSFRHKPLETASLLLNVSGFSDIVGSFPKPDQFTYDGFCASPQAQEPPKLETNLCSSRGPLAGNIQHHLNLVGVEAALTKVPNTYRGSEPAPFSGTRPLYIGNARLLHLCAVFWRPRCLFFPSSLMERASLRSPHSGIPRSKKKQS